MLLLSCSQLTRGFDHIPLFEDLAFELYAGQRVGLVGPNGAGKTTLLRLLAGLDSPDRGEVRLHAGARAALVEQQPKFAQGQTVFAEALTGLEELVAAHDDLVHTAEALAKATDDNSRKALAQRYERLNEKLHHHDAYNVDHRVEKVLDGLGFTATDYERPVETLSGGQQSRLMLAKLLLSEPDVMLLDEPSNHLDIAATSWLEDYLVKESGAMLIVSHDRYFLDRVATQIFELTSGGLESYPGNYQAYWRLRQERFEQRLKAWEAQQEYVQKQEEYIRRVHYGQLHKQAESRRKALEKLERVDRPRFVAAPHMHFGEVRRTGDVVLRTESLSKSYDRPLFRNLSFQLERGQRLGIMGANGSGKTTLVRVLMGQESPDQGSVERGHRVEFGYYDQHLRILPEDQSVMDAVWPEQDRTANTQAMRDLLARFGLVGEQVDQPVRSLSGGERSRAALARLVAGGANVLVLDEPTNHLDLWACEALEQALLDFQGTTIVVSHDRYFLNRVAQLLIVLEGDGQVRVVHGNYTTYDEMRLAADEQDSQPKKAENAKPVTPAGHEGNGRTAVSSDTKRTPKRKRRFPYRKIDDLEAEIAAAETRLQELQALLASSELYRDGDRVKETMQAFEQTRSSLQHLYDHWEESVELN